MIKLKVLQARVCSWTVIECASYCPCPPSTGLNGIQHLTMVMMKKFPNTSKTIYKIFLSRIINTCPWWKLNGLLHYAITCLLLITGFRLSNENETENYVRANLETNHDGKWKQVSSDNWNWKKTQVTCRDLLDLE
jgi:hypothetical protein